MAAVAEARPMIGVVAACIALGLARATYYRRLKPKPSSKRRSPPRALSGDEKAKVLAVLHEPRFADLAPVEVYATLLDEQRYLCSPRTMYRILAENQQVRERRNLLRHPNYAVPQVVAAAPNELWSWDISVPQQSGVGDER